MRLPSPAPIALRRSQVAIRAALVLVLGVLCLTGAPALAQDTEEGEEEDRPNFSLPAATPSPSDEVQGPADERAGVRIGPRLIRPSQVPSSPANAPPQQSPAPAEDQPRQELARPVENLFDDVLTPSNSNPSPAPENASSAEQDRDSEPQTAAPEPGFSIEDPSTEGDTETPDSSSDAGDWVDIVPAPSIDIGGSETPSTTATPPPILREEPSNLWLWLAIAGGTAILALIAWMAWRSRQPSQLLLESNVASTAREQLAATMSGGEAMRPRRPTAPPPPDVTTPVRPTRTSTTTDLILDIVGATRSVMKFTLQYRLTVANRAEVALHDISLMGQLTSAVRGAANAPSPGIAQSLGAIDRIGPQQSHTITGMLELPMVDVRMIRQGSTPVFIPLLHLTIDGREYEPKTSSFVIGVPSNANRLKLHPIALDGAPGTVHNLKANLVKPRAAKEPA